MDKIIQKILQQLETRSFVKQDDLELYGFGIECLLLKIIHIISYVLIGLCMKELLSLLISGAVLIPLRRKTGGYHAKTRTRCYVFSCCVVFLLCLANKTTVIPFISYGGILVTNILILLVAPIENENRKLDPDELALFRRQARKLLFILNTVIIAIYLLDKYLFLAHWLENGMIFAGGLLIIGIKKDKPNTFCSIYL